MVEKLKKWRKVKKHAEHVQFDKIGYDFYLITDYDDGVQFVCDFEHIVKITKALIDLKCM